MIKKLNHIILIKYKKYIINLKTIDFFTLKFCKINLNKKYILVLYYNLKI